MTIMFKQNELNIRHNYNDHVGFDMAYKKFQEICSNCWKTKYEFLVISKDDPMNNGRHRKGLDVYTNQ